MKEKNYKVHRMKMFRTGLILIVTMATQIVCSAERVAPPIVGLELFLGDGQHLRCSVGLLYNYTDPLSGDTTKP